MTGIETKVIGEFLRYYESDLEYIVNFRRFIAGEISIADYSSKTQGSFYSFLIEFKIARNIVQGAALELLLMTKEWCLKESCDDIDAFAKNLKAVGISRGATLSSLASKVLFLNNPWEILPMDALARKSLGQKNNLYSEFRKKVEIFRKDRKESLNHLSKEVTPLVIGIESYVKKSLPQVEAIRRNRLTDKMLWIMGLSIA